MAKLKLNGFLFLQSIFFYQGVTHLTGKLGHTSLLDFFGSHVIVKSGHKTFPFFSISILKKTEGHNHEAVSELPISKSKVMFKDMQCPWV